jgi:hypothetical protein
LLWLTASQSGHRQFSSSDGAGVRPPNRRFALTTYAISTLFTSTLFIRFASFHLCCFHFIFNLRCSTIYSLNCTFQPVTSSRTTFDTFLPFQFAFERQLRFKFAFLALRFALFVFFLTFIIFIVFFYLSIRTIFSSLSHLTNQLNSDPESHSLDRFALWTLLVAADPTPFNIPYPFCRSTFVIFRCFIAFRIFCASSSFCCFSRSSHSYRACYRVDFLYSRSLYFVSSAIRLLRPSRRLAHLIQVYSLY